MAKINADLESIGSDHYFSPIAVVQSYIYGNNTLLLSEIKTVRNNNETSLNKDEEYNCNKNSNQLLKPKRQHKLNAIVNAKNIANIPNIPNVKKITNTTKLNDEEIDVIENKNKYETTSVNNTNYNKIEMRYESSIKTDWQCPLFSTINNYSQRIQYNKSWICSFCNAMNKLLDTLNIYNMHCAVCELETYIPGITDIIMCYEWDHKTKSNITPYIIGNKCIQQNNITKPYNYIKDTSDRQLLIIGLIRNTDSRLPILFDIYVIDMMLFYSALVFSRGPWDRKLLKQHNKNSLVIDNNNIRCLHRTFIDKECFKNAFGRQRMHNPGRYEWVFKMKQNEKDENNIAIGVVPCNGIMMMGAPFLFYDDCFGKYWHKNEVKITLQWISIDKCIQCQLLFDGNVEFELDAKKTYRLAVAMKCSYDKLTCIKMERY
eukprot:77526_1